MRILLDEDVPRRLANLLVGHDVSTVPQSGWAGIKNGKLLALARALVVGVRRHNTQRAARPHR